MKLPLSVFILLPFFLLFSDNTNAACYSTGNGNWNNASTWLCNGVNAVPGCGDTIYIETGHTVTVTNQNNYNVPGCAAMHIVVAGTLDFTNGNKIDLPCGSSITILSGGLVYKSTPGGGSSTMITICGNEVWKAGDGSASGPLSWGGPPLPIRLVYFNARLNSEIVITEWLTASEQNNHYFTIERSSDAYHWKEIGKVQGANNSNTMLSYQFVDKDPLPGVSYYRLKQTDYDGKTSHSEIVPITNGDVEIINVFPNPATDVIQFVIYSKEEHTCSVQFYNGLG